MSQVHFDFQQKINALEGLNADLQANNNELKQKVADLSFEIALLKDICNLDDSEDTDALIEDLRQNIRNKHVEILALELSISDKDTEIENLKAALVEKDAVLAEKDAILAEKDAELSRFLIQNVEPISVDRLCLQSERKNGGRLW